MTCTTKVDLESKVDSAVHHLQMSLEGEQSGDPKYALGELKRMAQDLIDAWDRLRKHEDQHRCNA